MNRAERRRLKRQEAKKPKYNGPTEQARLDAAQQAAGEVLKQLFCIPVIVLSEHYGSLMRKEVNGASREERFADLIFDYYRAYERGEYTVNDMLKRYEELTGYKFEGE